MAENDRVVCRWWFDPSEPYRHQEWQIKIGDKWQTETDREVPTLNKMTLIEMWWKVLVQDQYKNHRSISTVAKEFNTTVRNVKTQRAYINTQHKIDSGSEQVLLPDLADWTPHEQSRIDAATKSLSVGEMFDALPPRLKEAAMAYLNKAQG